MVYNGVGIRAAVAGALIAMATAAQAGGFSRGTADTDILFEPGNFAARAGVTVIAPSRKYTASPLAPHLVGTNQHRTYAIPSAAVKYQLASNFSCAGTYTQPLGASSEWAGPGKPGASGFKQKEDLLVHELGLTCGFNFDVGKGRLWLLGGGFLEQVDYDLDLYIPAVPPLPAASAGTVSLEGRQGGFRLGAAYEIPDIALRGQILYRSGTTMKPDGTADLGPFLGSGAVSGRGKAPQSVELKLQSGIAPGWLAFGSVKWTDWSVNERLTVTTHLGATPDIYNWRDGWTVTGGVGHAFTDRLSGSLSFTWDKGVSTGYDLRSTTYTLAAGASYKDDWGGEFRGGLGLIRLTSAEEFTTGSAVDSGWAYAASLSYRFSW